MKKEPIAYFSTMLLVLSFLILSPELSVGAEKLPAVWGSEMYAGIQMDSSRNSYSFIGLGVDRIINEQWSFAAKIFPYYMTYEYKSGDNMIKATVPGGKITLGANYYRDNTLIAPSVGFEFKDTHLKPSDPESDTEGQRAGAVFEVYFNRPLSEAVTSELLGSYHTLGDGFWGRARVKNKIKFLSGGNRHNVSIGIEGIGYAGNDYSGYQIGGLLELQKLVEQYSILLASGYRHSQNSTDSIYIGIESYLRF